MLTVSDVQMFRISRENGCPQQPFIDEFWLKFVFIITAIWPLQFIYLPLHIFIPLETLSRYRAICGSSKRTMLCGNLQHIKKIDFDYLAMESTSQMNH